MTDGKSRAETWRDQERRWCKSLVAAGLDPAQIEAVTSKSIELRPPERPVHGPDELGLAFHREQPEGAGDVGKGLAFKITEKHVGQTLGAILNDHAESWHLPVRCERKHVGMTFWLSAQKGGGDA